MSFMDASLFPVFLLLATTLLFVLLKLKDFHATNACTCLSCSYLDLSYSSYHFIAARACCAANLVAYTVLLT